MAYIESRSGELLFLDLAQRWFGHFESSQGPSMEFRGKVIAEAAHVGATESKGERQPDIRIDHVRAAMEAEFRKLDREPLGSPAP